MTTSRIIMMNIVGPSLQFFFIRLIMTIVFLALCMGTHTRLHAYHYYLFIITSFFSLSYSDYDNWVRIPDYMHTIIIIYLFFIIVPPLYYYYMASTSSVMLIIVAHITFFYYDYLLQLFFFALCMCTHTKLHAPL